MFSAASVPAAEAALACGNHELPPLFCSVPRAFLRAHVHVSTIVSIGGEDPVVLELIHLHLSMYLRRQLSGTPTRDTYGRSSSSASVTTACTQKYACTLVSRKCKKDRPIPVRGDAAKHRVENTYKEPNAVAKD